MFFLHDFGVLFSHMIVCCVCYTRVIGADKPETIIDHRMFCISQKTLELHNSYITYFD